MAIYHDLKSGFKLGCADLLAKLGSSDLVKLNIMEQCPLSLNCNTLHVRPQFRLLFQFFCMIKKNSTTNPCIMLESNILQFLVHATSTFSQKAPTFSSLLCITPFLHSASLYTPRIDIKKLWCIYNQYIHFPIKKNQYTHFIPLHSLHPMYHHIYDLSPIPTHPFVSTSKTPLFFQHTLINLRCVSQKAK